ncbi:MAG: DUF3800 domain-containing protein [Anaerolineae bacterium]
MILFYIDESGTGLGDKQTPFFVLAAVAIPVDQWQLVDAQITGLKRRLISWAKPEDFEIKGRDMRRGEKLFKGQDWGSRTRAIRDVAQLIADLPCRIITIQVDKRDLPDYIGSDDDLYRLAFWRLLEELETELDNLDQPGMLMVDMRSDMHSSVQDRRLVDAYREWVGLRGGQTRLVELPWFGFSAFYAGLQLADSAAYLIDFGAHEGVRAKRSVELQEAFAKFRSKVCLVHVP